jgi:uncharacterized protein YcfJ
MWRRANFMEAAMNAVLRNALAAAGMVLSTQAAAQIVFYENDDFRGRSFTAEGPVGNFERYGFNDRASSAVVLRDPWEVCEDARFGGRCVVLRPGRYASLRALGLNDRISSARMVGTNAPVEESRYAPAPLPVYDNYRRNHERLFDADVTSVRAIVGPPEQRCWVERQQVAPRSEPNLPGAIVGGLIGGVLGHQIGNGRGNDAATVGGAVVGAAVGSNVGRDGDDRPGYTRDVQRCSSEVSQSRPEYWDVTYDFRGQQHRIQMTSPPGRTVTVNEFGEPRA